MEIIKELEALKQENIILKEQMSMCVQAVNKLLEVYNTRDREISAAINTNTQVMRKNFNNLKYELFAPDRIKDYIYPHFRSDEETLRLIIDERKSLGRYGDGEFSLCAGIMRQPFQHLDDCLAERLKYILKHPIDNMLIGIAKNYGDLSRYGDGYADSIRNYMSDETRSFHAALLLKDYMYTDAYITRPYVMHKDNMTDAPRKRFEAIRRIWDNKSIILIEGSLTRLGMGNNLFDNAASVKRIVAPGTSSFDRYDDILKAAFEHAGECDLYILAIGPSSAVLTYDLSMEGIQAVDVGNLDIEYEWFLAGKGERVPVLHKYNNEVAGGHTVDAITTDKYKSEIIEDYSI